MVCDIIKQLREAHPLSLRYNEDLIDRVYKRYPAIPKYKIAMIVKSFFEVLRGLFMMGDSITIQGLINNLHFTSFAQYKNGRYIRVIRPFSKTPKHFNE